MRIMASTHGVLGLTLQTDKRCDVATTQPADYARVVYEFLQQLPSGTTDRVLALLMRQYAVYRGADGGEVYNRGAAMIEAIAAK